jgi:hypothetical protein
MSVRETINSYPRSAAALIVIAVLLICIGIFRASRTGITSAPPTKVYFTTDDSSPDAAKAALFADSAKNLPPFQKDGKTAYLACVFTCDGGKTTWVGYLERYTPEKLQQIQNSTSAPDQAQSMTKMQSSMRGIQIKRPGDLNWTDCGDIGRSIRITDVRCPDGSRNNLTMVTP